MRFQQFAGQRGLSGDNRVQNFLMLFGSAFAALLTGANMHGNVPIAHGLIHHCRTEPKQPARSALVDQLHVKFLVADFPFFGKRRARIWF